MGNKLKMNILYVGDNRDRVNWGCRATSKALQSLLEKHHVVKNKIDGVEAASYSFSKSISPGLFPNSLNRFLFARKNRVIFKTIYDLTTAGTKDDDYLEEDIEKSIDTFLKIKKINTHLENIYQLINTNEVVVINGEGDFIFTTPSRRNALFYLFILKLAQKLNKKTYLVNAMFSDCPKTGLNKTTIETALPIFEHCNLITTRDETSYEYLKPLSSKVNLKFLPDALFSWYDYFKDEVIPPHIGDYVIPFPEEDQYFGKFDFSKPYIIISGSSSAAWDQNKAIEPYSKLVVKIKEIGLQVYLVPTCGGDNFLKEVAKNTNTAILPVNIPIVMGASILAKAEVMISGRFHPSILASLGGTPCVFLGSNSHKTKSLQSLLDYREIKEYNALPSDLEIENIKKDTILKLKEGDKLRNEIKNTVRKQAGKAQELANLII